MRFKSLLIALSLILAAPAAPVLAQGMERAGVTSNRIVDGVRRSAPAVYRQVPADFVMVAVTYQSGTRDAAERSREPAAMFGRLKTKAAKTDGFSLGGRAPGQSTADIETVLSTDVYTTDYSNSGRFTLTLNTDTRPEESFETLMARATAFITTMDMAGRSQACLGDEQFIGARDVAKHRADLVADIAA
ncbi:MAG: hypothetical protein WEA77_02975 [Hyphomonas sp.]|uniref:hypothetical protein n=1 Tax=Hyphomonas sp. TaxID=87 RepID=UPI0034A01C0B